VKNWNLNIICVKREGRKMIDFIDIEDWMIIGPAAEEWADMEQEKRRIEKDYENDNDLCHDDEE
jgi:hypothetical protein